MLRFSFRSVIQARNIATWMLVIDIDGMPFTSWELQILRTARKATYAAILHFIAQRLCIIFYILFQFGVELRHDY